MKKRVKKIVNNVKKNVKDDKKIMKAEKMVKKPKDKMKKVMKEFSEGKLHSSSKNGPKVKSKAQALAIGYSEMKRAKKKK